MKKALTAIGFAAAVATSATLPAATRTWIGGTGTKVWGTASNWQDNAVPQNGDTAVFNNSVTFSAAVTLPSNITFNVTSGTVKFSGVVSGAGGVTKTSGTGELQFTGSKNTYAGPTKVSSKTFRFATLANIGTVCSLGQPTTAENAKLTISSVTRLTGTGSYTTDRPIVMGSQFFVESSTGVLTINGPLSGNGSMRGSGLFKINTYLAAGSLTNCGRTDKGTTQFMCPTNAFTCDMTISDGFFRGATLANKGQPCAFGAGSKITMGQTDYSTTGTLYYNGTTDATCDRDIVIRGFMNSTADENHWGGRFCNETKGTCLTLSGMITESYKNGYPNSTAALYLGGVGDGVLTSTLPGRMAFYKEDVGTWTLTGAHVAKGLMQVKAGRLNIDGSVSAECTSATKMTVLSGATLGGTGTVYGTTAVLAGGCLAPGAADRIGTLTFGEEAVSIADGAKVALKFGAGTNDMIVVGAGATFGGALNVDVSILGAATVAPGSYTLMTWGGNSAPTSVIPSATVPDGTSFAVVGNALVMTMVDSNSLTWKGGGATESAWDMVSPNWLVGGVDAVFAELDFVTFDDAGGDSPTVRIDETVHPSAVVVDAATTAYAFTGAGGITGHSTFTKRGAATLTVATSNSYTKATTVEAGKYVLEGTLDGSSVTVAHGASFNEAASGVVAGDDLTLTFGYGNHYLRGANTFSGKVVFDTRDHGIANAGNVYLYCYGSNALGRAESVALYGYSPDNNHFPLLQLQDNTFIVGKTLIAGNTGNRRCYLSKAGSDAPVGWHGDIVGESGSASGSALQIVNSGSSTNAALEIGTPGGTNEMRGKVSSFNFRGSGPIHCHSRIAFDGGIWPNRNDPGTVILYATNNSFEGFTVTQGTAQMGRANVIPAGACVAIGKNSQNTFSTFNLDGYDQTIAGLYEQYTDYPTHKNRVTTPSGKPATLTLSGSSNRSWGSSHSWIEGPLTLVKAGSHNFTLNGTNTYTGATLMQAGTLTLNSAKALGGTTNVVLTGGTIVAKANGALNATGMITVPNPASGTLSLADGTAQTVDWLVVDGIVQPSGVYSKAKAGANPRYAFLARGTGGGTLLVRKGSGSTIIIR